MIDLSFLHQCYTGTQSPGLEALMLEVSFLGNGVLIPIIATIILAIVFFMLGKKPLAIGLLAASALGEGVKESIHYFFKSPRPDAAGCKNALVHLTGSSLPSGHVIFYTIFFGLVLYYAIRHFKETHHGVLLAAFAVIMIILVGYSRVYLGAHFLIDVLAGYLVGGIILIPTILLVRFYEKREEES